MDTDNGVTVCKIYLDVLTQKRKRLLASESKLTGMVVPCTASVGPNR